MKYRYQNNKEHHFRPLRQNGKVKQFVNCGSVKFNFDDQTVSVNFRVVGKGDLCCVDCPSFIAKRASMLSLYKQLVQSIENFCVGEGIAIKMSVPEDFSDEKIPIPLTKREKKLLAIRDEDIKPPDDPLERMRRSGAIEEKKGV